jgi:hypothetical protein
VQILWHCHGHVELCSAYFKDGERAQHLRTVCRAAVAAFLGLRAGRPFVLRRYPLTRGWPSVDSKGDSFRSFAKRGERPLRRSLIYHREAIIDGVWSPGNVLRESKEESHGRA